MNAIQFFDWGGKGKSFLKRIYDNLVTDNVIIQYKDGHEWYSTKVLTKKYVEENNPALKYKEWITLEADFAKIPMQANFVYISITDDPILFSFKQNLSWEVDGVDIKNNAFGMSGNTLNILPSINSQMLRKDIEKEKLIIRIFKKQ